MCVCVCGGEGHKALLPSSNNIKSPVVAVTLGNLPHRNVGPEIISIIDNVNIESTR